MHSIRQILDGKPADLWSVGPEDTVYDAIRTMAEHGVGALLVMNGGELAGVVTERDYARKIVLEGRRSRETQVREVMTGEVTTIEPDRTAADGLAVMTDGRFRHLPVVEGGKVVGVVSIGDLVKAVIADQQSLIEQLEKYVTG